MNSLPEAPQPLAPALSQLPAYRAVLAPTPITASRVVAALMQLKDTANILLLLSNGSLLLGIVCGFGVPGLILYGLRWRQVRGRAGRMGIVVQAVLSLLHELFWTGLFYGERTATEPFEYHQALTVLYGLGALLNVIQLLVALTNGAEADECPATLTDEQPTE